MAPDGATHDPVIDLDEGAPVTPALPPIPRRASRNADGTVTLTLIRPVTITIRPAVGRARSETFEALTFRPLSGADFRAIAAASRKTASLVAFARSCGMKMPVLKALFDRLDGGDVDAGAQIIETFFTPRDYALNGTPLEARP